MQCEFWKVISSTYFILLQPFWFFPHDLRLFRETIILEIGQEQDLSLTIIDWKRDFTDLILQGLIWLDILPSRREVLKYSLMKNVWKDIVGLWVMIQNRIVFLRFNQLFFGMNSIGPKNWRYVSWDIVLKLHNI